MKKNFGVAVVLLLVAGALVFIFNSKKPSPSADSISRQNSSVNPAENSSAKNNAPSISSENAGSNFSGTISTSENLAAKAGEVIADTNTVADLPPETVLQNIRHAVRQFGEMFGGNPVGNNSEITSQLNGNNPKHINFIDPSAGMRINANGELVDAWNTPYFFHQLSASDMEIHSAGPDRKLWTEDDLVTR
jgi:hypothetical protein